MAGVQAPTAHTTRKTMLEIHGWFLAYGLLILWASHDPMEGGRVMIHYLLLKFRPGAYNGRIRERAEAAYRELAGRVDGIVSVQILENSVSRDSNADLMVRLELCGVRALTDYLEHPVHQHFVEEMEPWVSQRLTFDHMKEERRGRI